MICRHSTRFPIKGTAELSPDTQLILKQLRDILRHVHSHEWHYREPAKLDAPPDTKYISAYLTGGIESILQLYRYR